MDKETHKPTHLVRGAPENLRPDAGLTHGCRSAAARRGELPAGFEYLQPIVDSFADGWLRDLGGPETISAQREALLFAARACLVVILLAGDYVARHGFTDSKGKPQAVLGLMATYVNSLRLNLVAAGLERVAKDITPKTLDQLLAKAGEER